MDDRIMRRLYPPTMRSERLSYAPLTTGDLEPFHALVTDAHVKRYLFDGETMPREWCVEAIETSRRSFDATGLGLWLIRDAAAGAAIGFCGFWLFAELGPEQQLLYAFTAEASGRGLATEAGRALIAEARRQGMATIVSAVDEPNRASIRVLEKLGFEPSGSVPGAFGRTLLFRLG